MPEHWTQNIAPGTCAHGDHAQDLPPLDVILSQASVQSRFLISGSPWTAKRGRLATSCPSSAIFAHRPWPKRAVQMGQNEPRNTHPVVGFQWEIKRNQANGAGIARLSFPPSPKSRFVNVEATGTLLPKKVKHAIPLVTTASSDQRHPCGVGHASDQRLVAPSPYKTLTRLFVAELSLPVLHVKQVRVAG